MYKRLVVMEVWYYMRKILMHAYMWSMIEQALNDKLLPIPSIRALIFLRNNFFFQLMEVAKNTH